MQNKSPKIAGAGICCLDHFLVAPWIERGESAHLSDYFVQGGGLASTAVVAAARLGAKCHMFSVLGDDQVGDQIVSELCDEGVSTDGINRIPGAGSPVSFIHVDQDTGDRTIFHRNGENLVWDAAFSDLSPIAECGALLVDHCFPNLSIAAAGFARAHGVPVVADALPDRCPELIRHVDILIAPLHFARKLGLENDLDAALDAIHELGPTTAVITLGAKGSVYSDRSGRGKANAFKVDVVDTTGAGDVFHGAFAYGVARGWDTPICAEFASAVAAIKCTRKGGRTGIPSLEQTLSFMAESTS
ncbi:MAG: carbohydrate kinase family protein [Armatimonadota bacterium]